VNEGSDPGRGVFVGGREHVVFWLIEGRWDPGNLPLVSFRGWGEGQLVFDVGFSFSNDLLL
jgi:hypothetical protein